MDLSVSDQLVDLPKIANVTDLLLDRVRATPDRVLYQVKSHEGTWRDVSAAQFLAEVQKLARALIDAGLHPGDTVVLFAATRYEWTLVDCAILYAGGVTVPIYDTSSEAQVRWILGDSRARFAFVDTAERAETLRAASESRQVRGRRKSGPRVLRFADLGAWADEAGAVSDARLQSARSSRTLRDTASIVYSSGTTGTPKGCLVTHANFALFAKNIQPWLSELLDEEDAHTLLFLPLAHVLARAVQFGCLGAGARLAHTQAPSLVEDVRVIRPTFLLAVPRVFEKVYEGARENARAAGKGRIFDLAARTARRYSRATQRVLFGEVDSVPLTLRLTHALFDRLVYSKVRDGLGGKLHSAVSGASPLDPELAHFFQGIGIRILEGYGLTETTAPCAVNLPSLTKVGTVGLPTPGTQLRIAEDGEILVRGMGVFAGYHNNPEATEAAFSDGFFKTGDIGSLDSDGFLRVTGRLKEILVTANGKNVSPAPLEEIIRRHPLVAEALVVGDNKPYVAALVFLDEQALAQAGLSLERDREHLEADIDRAVTQANASVSRAESVRRFRLQCAEVSEANGLLTPSLKLKRSVAEKHFGPQIAELYQD